jgi:aminocarboxymuconate-semialdehyde decarboxylase
MRVCAIDIHHHYVPNSLLEEAKNHGKALGVELTETRGQKGLSFAGSPTFMLQADLSAVDERLKMMQESKLAIAALEAHTATLGYRLSGEHGESWCRVYNEAIRELITRHPDRFVGIASVPLQDPARAAKVLEDAIRDLKLSGGYIGTNVNGNYYGSTDFDPFWAKAQELDALIVMHPEDVAGSDKMGPYGLRLICGNPADSALALGFMTYSGVFDRFPNLKLCVLHGGGFFPYHLGRFDQGWAVRSGPRAPQAKAKPSAYLKNLYFDNMIYRVDTVDYLRKLAGADHILVGTDYPFSLGDWQAVDKIEALECSDAEKELMLEGNAKRLLKI